MGETLNRILRALADLDISPPKKKKSKKRKLKTCPHCGGKLNSKKKVKKEQVMYI